MIKIENTHIDNIVRAVYSARNAMNSWDKSDSDWETEALGEADLTLAKKLSKAGNDHGKYLRMINVTVDIIAPLYWYKEFDTYKIGTTSNSCSTMHKIQAKEFTFDDFSCEHLNKRSFKRMNEIIDELNFWRDIYNNGGEVDNGDDTVSVFECKDKNAWWQMIQLLPSSYNQKRTIQLNYQVLKNMYFSRKYHKLDEWKHFCKWVESLPYAKELIMYTGD